MDDVDGFLHATVLWMIQANKLLELGLLSLFLRSSFVSHCCRGCVSSHLVGIAENCAAGPPILLLDVGLCFPRVLEILIRVALCNTGHAEIQQSLKVLGGISLLSGTQIFSSSKCSQ